MRIFLGAFLYGLVGAGLTILPWLPDWDQNYLSGNSRQWYSVWMNPYFRGAISAVGVANLCVSFLELLELRDLVLELRRDLLHALASRLTAAATSAHRR